MCLRGMDARFGRAAIVWNSPSVSPPYPTTSFRRSLSTLSSPQSPPRILRAPDDRFGPNRQRCASKSPFTKATLPKITPSQKYRTRQRRISRGDTFDNEPGSSHDEAMVAECKLHFINDLSLYTSLPVRSEEGWPNPMRHPYLYCASRRFSLVDLDDLARLRRALWSGFLVFGVFVHLSLSWSAQKNVRNLSYVITTWRGRRFQA